MIDPAAALELVCRAPLLLRLYASDHDPDHDGLYALKPATGAATVELGRGDWLVSDGTGEAVCDEQAIRFTAAGESVYGWFLETADGGLRLAAQRFAEGPFVVKVAGSVVRVAPRLAARPA